MSSQPGCGLTGVGPGTVGNHADVSKGDGMSVKSKQSVEMEPGEYVIATVVKYTEVGQILSGGSEGPAEAALGLIGRDMDEATGDMPRGEVINCYEFKLADVKFTVDVVAKLPASRHTGDSWDDPVAE